MGEAKGKEREGEGKREREKEKGEGRREERRRGGRRRKKGEERAGKPGVTRCQLGPRQKSLTALAKLGGRPRDLGFRPC
ncbi:unnamed protein product [Victoria cruziana]